SPRKNSRNCIHHHWRPTSWRRWQKWRELCLNLGATCSCPIVARLTTAKALAGAPGPG
ncbi:hypothetical protein E4U50_000778, partial [Claviceps purpurea]